MKPLQISADTAVKLAAKLKVPIEHLMHMPQHILLQKIAELAKEEAASPASEPDATASKDSPSHDTEPS
ncbi:YycC family protein [Paenibacillus sanguinis]|uniref:YycC family protein n=1 Tax=Paenibacillus sanguinis TaxID=225906 RepID=UPI00037EAC1F|nr:YycC family protein [Paenibacillus sanguinis]